MHNDRVNGRLPLVPCAGLLAALALLLSGCGGGSSNAGATGPSSSTATGSSAPTQATSATTTPGVVQGVKLTAQGSRLRVGQAANVSWQPNQNTVGVVKMTVTGVQKEPIGTFRDWRLDPATLRSTPYFVHASVRNVGTSNLSRVAVPLYLLDHRNTLLQASTFRARFPSCPSRPLPSRFVHGKKASVCLVYFAPQHGTMAAVSFRPTQDFNAITWRGHAVPPKPHHTKH